MNPFHLRTWVGRNVWSSASVHTESAYYLRKEVECVTVWQMYSPPPQAEGRCQVARGEAGRRKDKLKLRYNSMSLPKQKNEGGPSYASPREYLLVEMLWSGPTRFPLRAKPCELPTHSLPHSKPRSTLRTPYQNWAQTDSQAYC